MSKQYTSRVVAINAFGDGIVPLPEDMIRELDWQLHDELHMTVEGQKVIIKNITKEKRDGHKRPD